MHTAQHTHTHLFPKTKASVSAPWEHNCSAAQPDLGQVLDGGRMAVELSCGFLTDWICPLICSWMGSYCGSQNAVSVQIELSEAWEEREEMELDFAFQGNCGVFPRRHEPQWCILMCCIWKYSGLVLTVFWSWWMNDDWTSQIANSQKNK